MGLLLIASLIRHDVTDVRKALANNLGHELSLLSTALVDPMVVGDYTLIGEMLNLRAKHPDFRRIAWTDTSMHVIEANSKRSITVAPDWFARLADVPDIEGEQTISVGGQQYGTISIRLTAAGEIHPIWSAAVERAMIVAVGIVICLTLTSRVLLRGIRPFSELAFAARRFGRGTALSWFKNRRLVAAPLATHCLPRSPFGL